MSTTCCPTAKLNVTITADGRCVRIEPANLAEWIIQKVQWIELAEKVAEFIDEWFHLFQKVLVSVTSPAIYAALNAMHHGAHHFEQFLHCFCLIGDIVLMVREGSKYLREPNFIGVAAKISRLISHIFAPVILFSELKIVDLGAFGAPFRAIAAGFSAAHYGLAAIGIVWNHFKHNKKMGIVDIAAPLCGFAYHTFTVIQCAIPQSAIYLAIVKAIAGVAHAALAIYQLLPANHYHLSPK